MHTFRHILFASEGLTDDAEALSQALRIARDNCAELKALIVCPAFPEELARYRGKYEAALAQGLQASLEAARQKTMIGETELAVAVDVESGALPSERIIRHVLQHAHDLVLKEAECTPAGKGFRAVDMELLRKCPCPVWLSRPIRTDWHAINVGVAIDPEEREPEGRDLSLRLLQLARSLADRCNGELHLISCWDYPFEDYLRNSPWIKMPDDALLQAVTSAQHRHRAALGKLLKQSGVGGKLQMHHVRGAPDQMIPQLVSSRNIDILVIGTVARTGIAGFVIGNTAENVVQKLGCSLLASKPNGFVSPVKAY